MWNKRQLIVLTLGALALVSVFLFSIFISSPARALAVCRGEVDERQAECIFRVIERELMDGSMKSAMAVFSQAYKDFPSFVQPGCHKQAHRVGDIVYARLYSPDTGVGALDFPQETTACGYGFFHGFLEHLTQDNPDPSFVDTTCLDLRERLGGTMGAIGEICFHGSGHGFALAHAETLPKSSWGNVREFTVEPASMCDKFTKAREREREECKEGVFNVLVEWMSLGQYGFTFNREEPFRFCDAGPKELQSACYYETAQKLDGLAHYDPVAVAEIVAHVADKKLRTTAFQVGVAGIVQNTILDENAPERTIARCALLEQELFEMCLGSFINGLFEHGSPQEEYKRALDVCALPAVQEKSAALFCYDTIALRLDRFYSDDQKRNICALIPAEYRDGCIDGTQ